MSDQPTPAAMQVEIPTDAAGGVHADMVNIWHTAEAFTLDFMALKQPPYLVENENGEQAAMHDVIVTARVRMPPTHVFELMKALETQLTHWETETGRRTAVEPPHPDMG